MAVTIVKKSAVAPGADNQPAVTPAPDPAIEPAAQLIAETSAPPAPEPQVDVPPWEDLPSTPEASAPAQTAMEALQAFASGADKRTLTLVSKHTGRSYTVKSWEPSSGRSTLHGPQSMVLRPIIGERENAQYYPIWR